MTTAQGKAEHRDMTAEAYHENRTHDSNSSLREFDECPPAYRDRRILGCLPALPPSREQKLGVNAHMATVQPELYQSKLRVIPAEALGANGKRAGKKYHEWLKEHDGLICLTEKEAGEVEHIVARVYENPRCREFLQRCTIFEYPIFYEDAHGHALKCMPDAADTLDPLIVEIKTANESFMDFPRVVAKRRYYRQAALICDGFEAMFGCRPAYWFLVVRKVNGSAEAYMRRLPDPAIELGRQENLQILGRLYECKGGHRPWCSEGALVARDLELPPWFLPDNPYERV